MRKNRGLRSALDSLERNFAAAGLAEGDPTVAIDYLEGVEGREGASFIGQVIKKTSAALMILENSFAAAGLAEGDPSIAKEYLDNVEVTGGSSLIRAATRRIKAMLTNFENSNAAVAMAEGGPELAMEFLISRESQPKESSFLTFIKDIGLQDIPVQYGIATFQVEIAS